MPLFPLYPWRVRSIFPAPVEQFLSPGHLAGLKFDRERDRLNRLLEEWFTPGVGNGVCLDPAAGLR